MPRNAENRTNPIRIVKGKLVKSLAVITSGSKKKSPSPIVVVLIYAYLE